MCAAPNRTRIWQRYALWFRVVRVTDLAAAANLRIRVAVPGPDGALQRPITWCVSTESIDPTPFLTPGALMLTSGMALNFTDSRIWDAYVERLAGVGISALAFGLGVAHQYLPGGLVDACTTHGLPLLVIPAGIPFAHVQREAQDRLSAERYAVVQRGSALADECTRIAAAQGTVHDVLDRIGVVLGARLSIQDSTGTTLLSTGPATQAATRTEFSMPGSDNSRFRLVVEEQGETPMLRTMLAPVTAVISMQLSTTLGSSAVAHSRNAGRLTEAIYGNAAVPTEELIALTRAADLDPHQPLGLVVLQAGESVTPTHLRAVAWRARVILGGEFPSMRYVDEPDISTILLQGGELALDRLTAATRVALGPARAISAVVGFAHNAAELGLSLRLARRTAGEPGVVRTPLLDFDAVIDTLRHPGAVSLSRRLLAPLDQLGDSALRETLDCYLRHSGARTAVCSELFIHRNTLAYRLKRLEEILGLDLRDGLVRATLLMALRLA